MPKHGGRPDKPDIMGRWGVGGQNSIFCCMTPKTGFPKGITQSLCPRPSLAAQSLCPRPEAIQLLDDFKITML